MPCRVINLEAGHPSVEYARHRLEQELRTARARGDKALKIIHGYGSSGKGGAIKRAVDEVLAQKRLSNAIREYVKGEDFSPFSEASRRITAALPALIKDSDYSRGNDGITIVLL